MVNRCYGAAVAQVWRMSGASLAHVCLEKATLNTSKHANRFLSSVVVRMVRSVLWQLRQDRQWRELEGKVKILV